MLTAEQSRALIEGDVIDVKIVGGDHKMGEHVDDVLKGRIFRVVVSKVQRQLLSNAGIPYEKQPFDNIARTIKCQALNGANMPGYVTRVEPPEGERSTSMALYDWMIEDIHFVARGRGLNGQG